MTVHRGFLIVGGLTRGPGVWLFGRPATASTQWKRATHFAGGSTTRIEVSDEELAELRQHSPHELKFQVTASFPESPAASEPAAPNNEKKKP